MSVALRCSAALLAVLTLAACSSGEYDNVAENAQPSAPPSPSPTGTPTRPSNAADPPSSSDAGGEVARVIGVLDGDTVDVILDGHEMRVRLIGVNSPESGECYAAEAARWLEERIDGREIAMIADTSQTDRYGRLLRYVELDGIDINAELVRTGHAIARRYSPDTARADAYESAQRAAEDAGTGMWAADGGCISPLGSDTGLVLTVEADAPGDDSQNLNGEWLEIRNEGGTDIDLDAWTVRDESASHRYVFDRETVISPGETLILRSGCGQATRLERFWCTSGSAIWNNDGDTAFLLDREGRIVTSLSY